MSTLWPNATSTIPRVSSEFNPNRLHPITKVIRPHTGIDLVGFSTICSPVDGDVIYAAYNGGWGNHVKIRASNGDEFWHAHCARFLVARGTRVRAGQPVAVMGTTGLSTGIHLHWEVHPRGGAAVNPRTYMQSQGRPASGGTTPIEEEDVVTEKDKTDIANKVWARPMEAVDTGTEFASPRESTGRRLRRVTQRAGRALAIARRTETLVARIYARNDAGAEFYKHGDMPASNPLWMWVAPTGDFVRIREQKTAALYKERNGGRQATVLSGPAIRQLRDDLIEAGGRDLSAVEGTTETVATTMAQADEYEPFPDLSGYWDEDDLSTEDLDGEETTEG